MLPTAIWAALHPVDPLIEQLYEHPSEAVQKWARGLASALKAEIRGATRRAEEWKFGILWCSAWVKNRAYGDAVARCFRGIDGARAALPGWCTIGAARACDGAFVGF